MSLVKWGFISIILLPVAEFAVFIIVALFIGLWWTLLLFLATSMAGVFLLRHSGRRKLSELSAAVAQTGVQAIHLESPGLAAMLGGILLVLPGFITDVVGTALLIPPLRRWAAAAIGRAYRESRRDPHAPTMIELAPDQYEELPTEKIEDQRPDQRRRKIT